MTSCFFYLTRFPDDQGRSGTLGTHQNSGGKLSNNMLMILRLKRLPLLHILQITTEAILSLFSLGRSRTIALIRNSRAAKTSHRHGYATSAAKLISQNLELGGTLRRGLRPTPAPVTPRPCASAPHSRLRVCYPITHSSRSDCERESPVSIYYNYPSLPMIANTQATVNGGVQSSRRKHLF